MRGLLAGEESAFERFAADYFPPLYRFALRRLGDVDVTRDIVQSTLCKAIAKLATFRGEAALSTWLCACCLHEIAAHFRRRGRAGTQVELSEETLATELDLGSPPGAGPEQELLARETAELVHAALDLLPPRHGRALEWKYIERLSVDEIAARLEIGPKAAESVLSRARVSFREIYRRLAASGRRAVAGSVPVTPRRMSES
ncbi:MAG: RNA polymerase sigma factor [Thermoanaerobaculia bacterium]